MGHTQVVKVLLDSKASIDIQDSDGCTALHKAASQVRKAQRQSELPFTSFLTTLLRQGHVDTTKLLISSQANTSIVDDKGRTAKEVSKAQDVESCFA